ncbi:MAG: LamG-like jellyroll fold domain-containing protein [bacterium]
MDGIAGIRDGLGNAIRRVANRFSRSLVFACLVVGAAFPTDSVEAAYCAGVIIIPNADPVHLTNTHTAAQSLLSEPGGSSYAGHVSVSNHTCHARWLEITAANTPNPGPSYSTTLRTSHPSSGGGHYACRDSTPVYCAVAISYPDPQCPAGEELFGGFCVNSSDEPDEKKEKGEPKTCPVPVQPTSSGPIHFGSGNKMLSATDYKGPGLLPLVWKRSYNSIDGDWRFSYSQHLTFFGARQTIVQSADGKAITYYQVDGNWETLSDITMTLSYDDVAEEWEVVHPNDVVEIYDDSGALLSITNRNGQTTTLSYTAGELISVTDHTGRSLTVAHNIDGRIEEVTDPAGNTITYLYNLDGMLEYVRYPDATPLVTYDNPTIQYHYENTSHNDLVTGITDELGERYSTYDYDTERRATLSERAGSVESTSVSYGLNNVVTVTNELGKDADYTFVVNKGIRKLSEVDGQATALCAASTSEMDYDANGFVDTHTDENGNVTDYTYNARGLVTSKVEAFGTADARTTTTTWHSTFRVPTQIVKPGQTIDMTYDSAGRLLTRTIKDTQAQTVPYVTTNNTRTTTYTYNTHGLVSTIDGPRTDVTDVTTYAYDTNGNLTTVTNALGHMTEIVSRDARGLPTAIDDANDTRTELAYDERGRLTSRTVKSSQGDVVTTFTYDLAGQLIKVDLPTGGHLSYEYDDAHRLIAIENELQERVEYTLDDAGNATEITHKGPGGTILQTQDQMFDELSRLREWVDGVNDDTDFAYDEGGNLTTTTDALNRDSSQTFDALDRIKTATDAATGVTNLAYDGRGNLTSVTDPKGVVTTYVYDGMDNLIQEVSADAGTTTYTFDAAGNLTQLVDGRSVTTNYTYDALNRMLTATYPGSTSENVTYAYDVGADAKGRLTSITDESGSTTYSYDDRGNVTQDSRVIDSTTYTTDYTYDLADSVTSMTYPSGRVVNYARDTQSRVNTISHTLSGVTEYLVDATLYEGRGMLSAVEFGNGLYQTMTYDAAGRPSVKTLTNAFNAAPVAYTDSATVSLGAALDIDVIDNDEDWESTALTIHSITQPAVGSVAINGDQTLEYTPSGTQPYTTSFTYRVTDGSGPSNYATVNVNVIDPNFTDTDGDGLDDAFEMQVGLDPYDATDTPADADGDGVDNYAEYLAGTDPLINSAGYSQMVADLTPLAHWKFDETSGSTAADASGNGFNGTLSASTSVGDGSLLSTGYATEFTGGEATITHNTSLNLSGDYTLQGFVRWTNDYTGMIYSKFSKYNGNEINGIILYGGSTGKFSWREGDVSLATNAAGMNDGQWRHVAFVRRGDEMEIWVNGELENIATKPRQGLVSTTSWLYLMSRSQNWQAWSIQGSMDEFSIHAQALTPARIKAQVSSLGDKDLDQIPSGFEMVNYHDPLDATDATADYDGDGASQYDEYVAGTDPMMHPDGYDYAVDADTPSAYWKLDDVTATAVDSSGNGLSGTYYSTYMQSQTGAITTGNSVEFDGGRLVVSNTNDLIPQADYTIEGFFRWTGNAYGVLYGLNTPGFPFVGTVVFSNYNGASEEAGRVSLRESANSGYFVGSKRSGLNDGSWRHYAFVRRGAALELYIDGVLDNTQTLPTIIAHTSTSDLYMMGRETIQQVDGGADQIAFYDHALSPGDIKQRVIQGKEPSQASAPKPDATQNPDHRWMQWLGEGELVAVKDKRSLVPSFNLYTLNPEGALEVVEPMLPSMIASVSARVVVDPLGISIETNSDNGEILYRRVPNGLQSGLIPVSGTTLPETWTYSYDAVSNITQIAKGGGNEVFGYDSLDRLNTYTLPSSAQVTYTYDAVGNRTSEVQSGVTQTHTYGTTNNRLLTQTGATLGYDGAGNRNSDQSGSRTYTYNNRNRLISVVDSSVTVGTYTYNALGQRARKVAGSADIDYVYNLSGQLIGEYANGTLIKEYVYMDGVPLAQLEGTQLTYLHTDHLGTPRIGTNSNANIIWRWDSDPFGEAAPNEDPDGDMNDVTVNLRFPGQYADMETGHHYNYFRTYDPSIGRYTQSDPIGLVGGLNTYAYAYGSPINFYDPDGRRPVSHGDCEGVGCQGTHPRNPNGERSILTDTCEDRCIFAPEAAICQAVGSAVTLGGGGPLVGGATGLMCQSTRVISCYQQCEQESEDCEFDGRRGRNATR